MAKFTQTIAWGLYLASSWTWCIGMFLPALLIWLFGWPGFIAFAVPNIAGVILFGYVVRNRRRSEQMIDAHGAAMRWFSIITIAFHTYFLTVLSNFAPGDLLEAPLAVGLIVVGPVAAACALAVLPMKLLLAIAALLWVASVAAFGETGVAPLREIPWNGPLSTLQLAPVMLVLAFGFLLCPYFDLTFHRAAREAPSPHAFAIFAPAFAIMILLTCAIWVSAYVDWQSLTFGHLLWQSSITMGLHLRELRVQRQRASALERIAMIVAPLAGLVIGAWVSDPENWQRGYVRFLVFYGLLFPTYAIVFMHPRRPLRRSVRNVLYLTLALLLALPFYEMGFVHERTWALLIPFLGAVVWIIYRWRGDRQSSAT